MPVAVQVVNPEDTLEIQRQKINNNDNALQNQGNSLESQQAAHIAVGHPSLYYSKNDIDSQQATQDTALTTHKSSGDHDARYLSAAYLTGLIRTTLDQTVDGIKKFLKNIRIGGGDTPAVELYDFNDVLMGKFRGSKYVEANQIAISIQDGGALKDVMVAVEGQSAVNFPNHDVQAKGNRLATESYVNSSVANSVPTAGSIVLYDSALESSGIDTAPPAFSEYVFNTTEYSPRKRLMYLHNPKIRTIRAFFESNHTGDPQFSSFELHVGGLWTSCNPGLNPWVQLSLSLNVTSLIPNQLYEITFGGSMIELATSIARKIVIIGDTQ